MKTPLSLSSTIGAIMETLYLPFISRLLSYTVCQTYCISSSWNNLHFLLFRPNQFSRKIDSCWNGSDYVPNVVSVSSTFFKGKLLKLIADIQKNRHLSIAIGNENTDCFGTKIELSQKV